MSRGSEKQLEKKNFDKAVLFILPGFIGFAAFYMIPFLISLGYSFFDRPTNGAFVGVQNYIDLFGNLAYRKGLKNTLYWIGTAVPLNMVVSLIGALAIHGKKSGKGKELLVMILLIPLVIPSGSMMFFWKSFFGYDGYLNFLLHKLYMNPINWLETEKVRIVIGIIFIWKHMGYHVILFLAGLSNIPREFYEAAKVEGATKVQIFYHITGVCLFPTFLVAVLMNVIHSFKVFKEIYIVTGNYPHESIYMLQHFMNNMFQSLNYPRLTSATTILVLMIALFIQSLFYAERRMIYEQD